MSTRAIIGVLHKDGSIRAAWQWSDGQDSGRILRKYFTEPWQVNLLVSEGSIRGLLSPRDSNLAWFREQGYVLHPLGKCFVVKEGPYDNEPLPSKPHLYKSIPDAAGQDLNYVYLYNPKTQRWKTIGPNYSYATIEKRYNAIPKGTIQDNLDKI